MLIWRKKVREVYNKVPEVESRRSNVECLSRKERSDCTGRNSECGVKNPKSKIDVIVKSDYMCHSDERSEEESLTRSSRDSSLVPRSE